MLRNFLRRNSSVNKEKYNKNPNNADSQKICCNYPKIWTAENSTLFAIMSTPFGCIIQL